MYKGDYFGTLYRTYNVDLDRVEGKVSLARRMAQIVNSSDTNADTLTIIDAFVRTNADCTDRFWGLNSGAVLFKSTDSSPSGVWAADALANSPTNARDMAIFENDSLGDTSRQQLFVTRDTHISVLNDTGNRAWTALGTLNTLKASVPHPIEYFPFRRIMLVGDANRLHTIQRASPTADETTTASRLILPSWLQIQHIFCTTNRAWLLCANVAENGNGKIVEWDGFSETYNAIHDAFGAVPLSGVNYSEVPIVINSKGMVLEFTGNGFSPMMREGQQIAFPSFFESNNAWWVILGNIVTQIRPRGMILGEDGLIYIGAEGPARDSFRQNGGIWCLDPISGRIYQKHSIGAWANTTYGEQRTKIGGLYTVPAGGNQANFLVGGIYNNNSVNFDRYGIWTLQTLENSTANRGHFITQFIPAEEIRDQWDTLWLRFLRFATSTNRFIVKAKGIRSLKTLKTYPLEKSIFWLSDTAFSVTMSAANDDALAVGDEVEVLNGDNSGCLAHITEVLGAHGNLQQITIDETLTTSLNEGRARFDRWKKLGVISNTTKYEDNVSIGIDSSFIQFKVELRGPAAEIELSDLTVNRNTNLENKK